jgi:hypothetical protein
MSRPLIFVGAQRAAPLRFIPVFESCSLLSATGGWPLAHFTNSNLPMVDISPAWMRYRYIPEARLEASKVT